MRAVEKSQVYRKAEVLRLIRKSSAYTPTKVK
jgi:hypothetical protein